MEQLRTIPVKAVTTREDAIAEVTRCNAITRDFVEHNLKELGLSWLVWDVGCGFWLCNFENPYDEIINIAHQVQCAMVDAWYMYFDYERLRRELAELKGRTIENGRVRIIQ